MNDKLIIESPKKLQLFKYLNDVKQHRELIYFLAWRNVKVKYKDAALGVLWAVIKPLFFMIVLVFVLKKGLNLSTDGIPPPLFYFVGLLYWSLFSAIVSKCTNSAYSGSKLFKSVYFPKMVLPISLTFSEFFDFVLGAIVLFGMVGLYVYQGHDVNILQYVISFFMSLMMTLWVAFSVGLWVAALNVKYRDMKHLVPFVLRILFFLTPIIFPVRAFKEVPWAEYVLAINPMTGALNIARSAFSNVGIDWNVTGISLISAVFIFLVGLVIFIRGERHFADIV